MFLYLHVKVRLPLVVDRHCQGRVDHVLDPLVHKVLDLLGQRGDRRVDVEIRRDGIFAAGTGGKAEEGQQQRGHRRKEGG